MFEHSVKVPRLYKTAAKIAERVKLHGESVKQVYDDKLKFRNIKALYALIVSTVQNDSNLEFLLKKSELLQKETRLEPWLAKVLITELLWGKMRLPGNSKPVQTILAYQTIFNDHLNDLEQPRNIKNKVDKPRYVRVNTLKISINEAVDAFRDEGWILVRCFDNQDYDGFLDKISNLEEGEFMVDIHIPYLLIFPPKTEFYNHSAYRNGIIALQDKASCLPSHILNPAPDSKVLDMCAAPGMKTTQLACILNGSGVIFAIERDLKRAGVLRNMIEASGAQDCVQVVERDVLDVCKKKSGLILDVKNEGKFKECEEDDDKSSKDEDGVYREADYILVDPSCSGSGMLEGPENLGNFRTDPSRLKKLAGFQIMILKHALRAFPSAKRVVYSTCSLNVEENEEVVREVLQSAQHFKLVDVKTLCSPWKNFGSDSYGDIGKYCLYSKPDEDLTNGFFVAVFDRLENGEENQFLLQREQNLNGGYKKGLRYFNYDLNDFEDEGDHNKMKNEHEKYEENFLDDNFVEEDEGEEEFVQLDENIKQKKKKNQQNKEIIEEILGDDQKSLGKIKECKKKLVSTESEVTLEFDRGENIKKKKKSKRDSPENLEDLNMCHVSDDGSLQNKEKKKKKKKNVEKDISEVNNIKKRKKEKRQSGQEEVKDISVDIDKRIHKKKSKDNVAVEEDCVDVKDKNHKKKISKKRKLEETENREDCLTPTKKSKGKKEKSRE